MKSQSSILKVELVCFIGVLLCSVILAVFAAAESHFSDNPLFGAVDAARIVFLYTFVIGVVLGCVLAAPLIVIVSSKFDINWPVTILIGVMPGSVLIALDFSLGIMSIFCGLGVSMLVKKYAIGV